MGSSGYDASCIKEAGLVPEKFFRKRLFMIFHSCISMALKLIIAIVFVLTLPSEISVTWFVPLQEGDFEMKHIDKVGLKTFNVAIAPFSLSTLGDGTEIF